jgi:hypothetical protein
MKIFDYTVSGFSAFLLCIALAAAAHAQNKPLSLKVHTVDENGFLVTSTLVMGDRLGSTPLRHARERGYTKTQALLEAAGAGP